MTVRRRRHGPRVTSAVCILVVVGLLLVPALALGQRLLLSSAAVLAYLGGVSAARLMSDEHVRTRREAARERARQARDYQRLFTERMREHDHMVAKLTGRLAVRDAEIARLNAELEEQKALAHESLLFEELLAWEERGASNPGEPLRKQA